VRHCGERRYEFRIPNKDAAQTRDVLGHMRRISVDRECPKMYKERLYRICRRQTLQPATPQFPLGLRAEDLALAE